MYTVGLCSDTVALIITGIGTTPQIGINSGSNPICLNSTVQICPTVWGWSNYQWYKNGVAIASPIGTASCITLDSTETGTYTLAANNGAGCWSPQSSAIVVTYDRECTDTVTTGNNGGVESKSLGDVIGKRLFGNAINNKSQFARATTTAFVKSNVIVNGPSSLTLSDITPTKAKHTNKTLISTPTDLINITNAIEVLSVDYLNNKQTKAVAFATKTIGDVYNHTKPICDRLKGSELQEVTTIVVKGIPLTAYKIKQPTGEFEYTINLIAGVASSRNTIHIQSTWLTSNALSDEILFNYQIWAVSYELASDIASEILTNLQKVGPIQTRITNDVPQIYVRRGKRINDKLLFTIQNNTSATAAYFEIKERKTEQSVEVISSVPLALKPFSNSDVEIDVKDNYEANVYLNVNGKVTDLVYLGDGAWTIEYDKNNTTINKFEVLNEPNLSSNYFGANEYRLMRNVDVKATTKENIVLYKTLQGGGMSSNLTAYKGIKFNAFAPGVSQLKITIIQKNILLWDNQFSYTINIDDNKEYTIGLDKFKSATIQNLNLKEVVGVTFNFMNSRGGNNTATINLRNVRFTKDDVTQQQLEQSKLVRLYPNPTLSNVFYTTFMSEVSQSMVLKLVEASTGKMVKTMFIQAQKGSNNVKIELPLNITTGMYLLQLQGDAGAYETQKLLINKK